MADTEKTEAPAEYLSPSQISPDVLLKAFQEDGIVETPPAPAPAAAKPAEPAPAAPPPPANEPPALLKIAQEKAELRRMQEAVKPYAEVAKGLTPQQLMQLSRAVTSGDPVGALSALGFSHAQYTQKLVGAEPVAKEEAPKSSDPVVETLKQEVERLRAEREAEKMQVTRQQTLQQMQSALKDDPKFRYINGLGDYEGVERVLINYYQQAGSLPGATFEESVKLAAEMYEADLQKQAERWSKVNQGLTPSASSAPVPPQRAPESPSAGTVSPRTLTNSNTTAPAAVRPVPKSREEILAAIREGRDEDLA